MRIRVLFALLAGLVDCFVSRRRRSLIFLVSAWFVAGYVGTAVAWTVGFGQGAIHEVVTDPVGDIYVSVVVGSDGVLQKLDPAGHAIWQRTLPSPSLVGPLRLDLDGDVIIGAVVAKAVSKSDGETGVELWNHVFTGASDSLLDLAVTAGSDVIVAGELTGSGGDRDFGVVELSGATGAELWRYTLDGAATDDIDVAGDVAIMPEGDVVAAGSVGAYPDTDAVVVRLDATTGTVVWQSILAGPGGETDTATAVAVNPAGDVVVGGTSSEAAGQVVALVRLLDGDTGAELWRSIDATPGVVSSRVEPQALRLDSLGGVAFLGARRMMSSSYQPFIRKVEGDTGAMVWEVARGARRLDIDASDAVVLAGDDPPFLLAADDFSVTLLDGATGAQVWRSTLEGGDGQDSVYDLALDTTGAALVAGSVSHPDGGEATLWKVSDRLAARKILVRDPGLAPQNRKLVVLLDDPNVGGAIAGEAGDPAVAGAVFQIANPDSGESQTIALPSQHWTSNPAKRQHVYRDTEGASGPCSKALIAVGKRVKLKCRGAGITFTLDEAAQGTISVKLTVPGGMRYCSGFSPDSVTRDETSSGGATGIFKAGRSPAPEACS